MKLDPVTKEPIRDADGVPVTIKRSKIQVDKIMKQKSIRDTHKIVEEPQSERPKVVNHNYDGSPSDDGNPEDPILLGDILDTKHHASRKKLVGKVKDLDLLADWLALETTESVKKAIKSRIEELEEPNE